MVDEDKSLIPSQTWRNVILLLGQCGHNVKTTKNLDPERYGQNLWLLLTFRHISLL